MKSLRFIKCPPHLPFRNLRSTLDYYKDKLGFVDEWAFGRKDGGICRDDLKLLFGEDATFNNDINNNHRRLPLMWFVNDLDEVLREFKERDIDIADDLRKHPHRLREFAFIDINGYYIRIAESTDKEE
jgi:hypothetical protein